MKKLNLLLRGCVIVLTLPQSEHSRLRHQILLQLFEEDADEGNGKRAFNPSHVLLSLAASAKMGENWRQAPNNERRRSLEILGLSGPLMVHDCIDHGSFEAPPLMNAKFGVAELISIHRAPGDPKCVATLVEELNEVHVDVTGKTPAVGGVVAGERVQTQETYASRHLSSRYIKCPKCLFEKETEGESTSAGSHVPQLARYSHVYSHFPRECCFLLVGTPDGNLPAEVPRNPMLHELSLFGGQYVLRAVVYVTSGGHQYAAQAHIRGCWRLYNDMKKSGKLVHAHAFDTDFNSGSEHMLMYVREDLVTPGESSTGSSQPYLPEIQPRVSPACETGTAKSPGSQPDSAGEPSHDTSGDGTKQVGAVLNK